MIMRRFPFVEVLSTYLVAPLASVCPCFLRLIYHMKDKRDGGEEISEAR